MKTYEKILLENKAWAEEMKNLDPKYFKRLSSIGKPKILWLGSADSRVEIREITNTDPGEIIVYRNLANLVKEDCNSFMSVLRYALYIDKIEHIIVCGHNHCSGIQEVLSEESLKVTGNWLSEVYDLYDAKKEQFQGMNKEECELYLARLNVIQQIGKLIDLQEIRELWEKEKRPKLHGWLYNCDTGIIDSIREIDPGVPRNKKEPDETVSVF